MQRKGAPASALFFLVLIYVYHVQKLPALARRDPSRLWKTKAMKTTTTPAKVRRLVVRTKLPPFRQLCAIVRAIMTAHTTESEADLKERIKQRHVALGFRYSNLQIPRAMDAVDVALKRKPPARPPPSSPLPELAQQRDPPWRTSTRTGEWTSLRELVERFTKSRSDPLT